MNSFFTQKGFLGSSAPLISDLSLVLILLTAISFTFGVYLARHKKWKIHGRVQTVTACINAVVVLIVMVRSFILHILPGIPGKLLEGDYAVSTIHGLVGTAGLLLGIFVVLRGHKLVPKGMRFKKYKPFMWTSYSLYMLATLLGVIVYIEAFVLGV